MTRDEFKHKWRGQFLLFWVDAWAARHEAPSSQGMLLMRQEDCLNRMLDAVFNDLSQQARPAPVPQTSKPNLKVASP